MGFFRWSIKNCITFGLGAEIMNAHVERSHIELTNLPSIQQMGAFLAAGDSEEENANSSDRLELNSSGVADLDLFGIPATQKGDKKVATIAEAGDLIVDASVSPPTLTSSLIKSFSRLATS